MWTPWYTTAFVIGCVCIVFCITSFLTPSRKITLCLRMGFDILSVFNQVAIFYATNNKAILVACVIDAVSVVRDIIYLLKGKYAWAKHWSVCAFFVVITGISLIFTWSGPISLLPTTGAILNTIGLFLTNQKKTKWINICGQLFFIAYYSILVPSSDMLTILNLVCSVSFFISCIIGLSYIYIKEHKQKDQDIA